MTTMKERTTIQGGGADGQQWEGGHGNGGGG
jgi:hypothetical protein